MIVQSTAVIRAARQLDMPVADYRKIVRRATRMARQRDQRMAHGHVASLAQILVRQRTPRHAAKVWCQRDRLARQRQYRRVLLNGGNG